MAASVAVAGKRETCSTLDGVEHDVLQQRVAADGA
jgi:hypothetical protein